MERLWGNVERQMGEANVAVTPVTDAVRATVSCSLRHPSKCFWFDRGAVEVYDATDATHSCLANGPVIS
jgi:hypothetical protein